MRTIEYQNRGLPHCHIVFRLSDGPNHSNEVESKQWIEQHISTTMPTITDTSTEEDIRYCQYVERYMVHGCRGGVNGCLDTNGLCKRKYSKQKEPTYSTEFDEKGYPVYIRPTPEDQMVVPHNRYILLDWGGHANLEFAASTYCIFYLYSYIYKGNRKTQISLDNTFGIEKSDEINLYLRGRMLSSMDAMWRIFGFHTYPAPYPSVTLLKIKLPSDMRFIASKGQLSDLYVYLNRPEELHHLKYCEFFNLYCYKYTLDQKRFRDDPRTHDDTTGALRYCLIQASPPVRDYFIYCREHPEDCITRIGGVPPNAGEIFYFRILLREIAATSVQDILTHNGARCRSFQEAAYEKGLLTNDNEAYDTFTEARLYEAPIGLRALFVLLTIQGFPTLRIYEDIEQREAMTADYSHLGHTQAHQSLLQDLYERFASHHKDMQAYGLPKPQILQTEVERERLIVGDGSIYADQLRQLHLESPNTDEMQIAYDVITSAIRNGESKFFLIRGCGGSGKTQFAKKVLYYVTYAYIKQRYINFFFHIDFQFYTVNLQNC